MENNNSYTAEHANEVVVPVLQEVLDVGTRKVETGRVRIKKIGQPARRDR
jgi:hypothetical protein